MKIKFNNIVTISIMIILLYIIVKNKSWVFVGDLEGQYVLYVDGNCHFLPYKTDTLVLKNDGSVISDNFPGNATYTVETNVFEKQINISYNYEKTGMTMPIERTLFCPFKIKVCMDQNTYYVKMR